MRASIIDRYKNKRRRTEYRSPAVISRSEEHRIPFPRIGQQVLWNAPGYHPKPVDGEDETSLGIHKQTCLEQSRLVKRSRKVRKCETAMSPLLFVEEFVSRFNT